MVSIGVYVHFPWCRRRCPYCDFAIEVGDPPHAAYADAIIRELHARRARFPGTLMSIYFGGGTPSLWEPAEMKRVIEAIELSYQAVPLEITLEANPIDCTEERLAAWRDIRIDRISIGVQSHDPDELVVLGRDHRFGDGPAALARVLAFGGFTVSADFILGTPTKRAPDSSWLDAITATAVDHVSVYELTIEERTPFGRMVRDGELVPRDEDALYELYVEAHDRLTAAGFEHYEISSYAREGAQAVHNSGYWEGRPFLGLGSGAASLERLPGGGAVRATNPRRAEAYLAGAEPEVVTYDAAEIARELAWLGMRTSEGVWERDLDPAIAAKLVELGLAERRNRRIQPTLRGFLMADRVASMIG